jgi:hypothetical protein
MDAVLHGDLGKPIDEWLKAEKDLGPSAQRQVASILLFLDLLGASRHLVSEALGWRCDRESASAALLLRVRQAYALAGCAPRQADLIGNPLLTKEALGRVLEAERPFQRLENADTRRNAVRFACHVHEAIVEDKLLPLPSIHEDGARQHTREDAAGEQQSSQGGQGRVRSSRMQFPQTFKDQATIVNPQRYRVARVRDDLWVYATVQFESPQGAGEFAWLNKPDADEQARWQEQLAAALLQDADSRKQSETY